MYGSEWPSAGDSNSQGGFLLSSIVYWVEISSNVSVSISSHDFALLPVSLKLWYITAALTKCLSTCSLPTTFEPAESAACFFELSGTMVDETCKKPGAEKLHGTNTPEHFWQNWKLDLSAPLWKTSLHFWQLTCDSKWQGKWQLGDDQHVINTRHIQQCLWIKYKGLTFNKMPCWTFKGFFITLSTIYAPFFPPSCLFHFSFLSSSFLPPIFPLLITSFGYLAISHMHNSWNPLTHYATRESINNPLCLPVLIFPHLPYRCIWNICELKTNFVIC